MNHQAYFYIAIEPIPSVEFNGQFNKGNGEASALSRFLWKNYENLVLCHLWYPPADKFVISPHVLFL